MTCLLLHWLIKTWNWEREEEKECKRERERGRELRLFPFWIHLQERNYSWLLHSSGKANQYEAVKKQQQQSFETRLQFSSLIAYNTLTLHSLSTLTPFELSLINLVYQTDGWTYLTVIIMTLYLMATVNRSGCFVSVYLFFCVFFLYKTMTVLGAELHVALCISQHPVSKMPRAHHWVNSCLNSVFSPFRIYPSPWKRKLTFGWTDCTK